VTTAAERRVPGEEGVWVFIFGDLLVFALFFGTLLTYRGQQAQVFAQGSGLLHQGLGVLDTVLLLTSSLLVALGVRSLRHPYFVGALLCAIAFVGCKSLEYTLLLRHGVTPATNDFFMYYFVFTGIHLGHVLLGAGVLVFLTAMARRAPLSDKQLAWVESGASYWHMVDLLWIVLFAVLYLVPR
jgi:nitric oxide reductase NorE protein